MRFRASGKVILLGEHAVVYGHPALAGALAGGASITTTPGRGRLCIPAWSATFEPRASDQSRPLERAYAALRRELGIGDDSSVDLIAEFTIPVAAGLGSSAALAVAVARALEAAHGLAPDTARTARAAMASETVIHGQPSGLDHTVALDGGFGLFVRGRGFEPLKLLQPLPLVVGHTGKPRDTGARVARVAALLAERASEVRERFLAIERLVEHGKCALLGGELGVLGQAMDENQRHLSALEVSSPEIERLCALAREAGAVGAKLTGGGGGGCVVALAPGREKLVEETWRRAGFNAFVSQLGGAA